tara:strand:- start:156 stop:1178 length:1023 start_codon:yes stop_codon:yes gene_type:complete
MTKPDQMYKPSLRIKETDFMQTQKAIKSVKASKVERKRLWQAAIKWPLYSVAIMPVFLAAGWRQAIQENIRWGQLIGFLLASIFLLIWENLTNDLFDSDTGVDKFKLHSVITLLGKRRLVSRLANSALVFGLLMISILSIRSHHSVLFLVLGSCALGYLYQGPPFRLGYHGLGEPLCWLAFGPLGTAAALLVITPHTGVENGIPWDIAILIGSGPSLATTLVLFCSHFHQVTQDAECGKKTSLVRLGTRRAADLVPWIIALILFLECIPIFQGNLPITVLLGMIALPKGLALITLLKQHHNHPDLISECKFLALQFQTLNGFGLSIGLAIAPALGINFAH